MTAEYQIAGGSMIGRDHRLVPKNNQDSWSIWRFDDVTIGIVADGCGSGAQSEVGAKLGVQLLGTCLRKDYRPDQTIRWQRVQQHMLTQLDGLAQAMGDDYRKIVEAYFLFTLLGVIIDDRTATFFALGDGTIIINGQQLPIGPFAGNMPPYLGYCLLPGELAINSGSLRLEPVAEVPVGQLESFLIATDGIDDVVRNSQQLLPGMNVPVGPIEQFWQNDRYFGSNPELVSRQLKLMGRDWPLAHPHPGLLSDDTTLIVGRRQLFSDKEET
jgi:serine/threonine protein phosphatase PrpC